MVIKSLLSCVFMDHKVYIFLHICASVAYVLMLGFEGPIQKGVIVHRL